jgi:hypothetical protein
MTTPRWMHRLYAWLAGYFWLPCPVCHDPFAGHEWRDYDGKSSAVRLVSPVDNQSHDWGICPACTREGRGNA